MPNSNASEEERIKAWRAERARIAEADKAARLLQREAERIQAAETAKEDRKDAALTLLSSSRKGASQGRINATSISGWFSKLGNWQLFFAMVVGPMILVMFYLFVIATPLYEAQSVIAITKSSDAGTGSRSGLLGSLEKPSNLPEVFRAHSYINSQALMDSLEAELALVSELSSDAIDPIQRLRTIPFLSLSKSMQFDRFVESSIDIQSGLLTLYVRAPSNAQAISVSESVLRNAEIQVSTLGQQLFDKRQSHAAEVRAAAETQVADAQASLVDLQFKYQEVDPRNRVESIYARIKELEDEAQRLDNEVQKAEIAGIGDSPQTSKLVALEAHIRDQIKQERSKLVAPNGPSATSLNNLLMEYELASLEVDLAREAVKTAIEAQAEAGREAALSRSLFQVVVPPRTAQTPIYPRKPGTLLLVMIICLTCFAAATTFRAAKT
ncbi:hypothetical protein PEL8287_01849 [Roseovarius litorisediminis]|uniref:Chain length determinant protein n=1 Tax=Roseovarius litorisediminis TaxID=1312363 RepID=A0A1Y5SFM8_9RHOB|nr:hypothetical protein [Roseovarius litorisediminis]SLN38007.1 hypothetical protein PEL8287_01849 [Roseovarius litorisediminis]